MKIYLIDDVDSALLCRQLIQLSADCARLQWSKRISDLPNAVDDALDTVQNYAEEKIHELCPEKNMAAELTSDNERALLSAGRSSAQLRRTIGSGVVLAGAEADEVWKEAQGHTEVQFIIDFLKSGKNLIML